MFLRKTTKDTLSVVCGKAKTSDQLESRRFTFKKNLLKIWTKKMLKFVSVKIKILLDIFYLDGRKTFLYQLIFKAAKRLELKQIMPSVLK